MIVQCPNCDSRYRVKDANVPASGGKITCPSCKHKFIVYPDTPDAPDTEALDAFEDKTSVAKAPALRDLVNQMAPSSDWANDDVGAATEVMSAPDIPKALGFGGQNDSVDGTVEMSNPDIARLRAQHEPDDEADDFASTEIISGDTFDHMVFNDPTPAQNVDSNSDTREHAPLRTQLEASAHTERLAPEENPFAHASPPPKSPPQPQHAPANTTPAQPAAPSMPAPPSIPSSQPAQPGPDEASAPETFGPNATHEGPWKLKTNFGLIYEFSDNDSLQNWLASREELDGYELAGDADYYPVSAWPQFQRKPAARKRTFAMSAIPTHPPLGNPLPGAPAPSAPGAPTSGPFDQASFTPQPGSTTPQPPSPGAQGWESPSPAPPRKIITPTDSHASSGGSKANLILWPIAGLLFAVGVLLAVQVLGVYDIKSAILGEAPATPVDQPVAAPNDAPAPDSPSAEAQAAPDSAEAVSPDVAKAVDRLIADAELAIENNRLQSASVKLNNAKLLEPKRVAIYVLFVKVYTEMGRTEDAATAQKTLDELRGTATPAAAED
ncbi:zinc-ribbon domain-containing protein [Bradymonas sediminis]|uniref:Uncharacterized protein n=1 Tax=Bradymonas sediminis TaxID=1548548 RepID=A0A2Z4FPA1_9DELT|nr:zinc-ribbon domain-containing protein [Bradymonas sediminis]AWV90566.1 hypothetical protein DN745_15015 [Bradymonas sediminis]TDP72037.1 putative Zn finger-like uncharacterized protein [Bradymonas sediminis]